MSSSSDNEMFLTQSKYSDNSSKYLDMNTDIQQPNFELRTDLFSDISDDDNVEIQPASPPAKIKTVQATPNISCRFSAPLENSDLQNIIDSGHSKKTEQKSMWAIRLFNTWFDQRHKSLQLITKLPKPDILQLNNTDLNECLKFFVAEIQTEKCTEYRPNTLYEIVIAIQHFLRRNNRFVSFMNDDDFDGMRKVLDGKMKALSKQGIGNTRKQADIITVDQENELWEKNILGTGTPQQLLDTLVYLLGLHFALRAAEEHRNLRAGPSSQIELKIDHQNIRYLQYTEDISKTNRGGLLHRKIEPKVTRAYQDTKNPDRCPVNVYEKYLNLRPKNGKCDALYLRPRKYASADTWFCDSPVGIHLLQKTVKSLCDRAGFKGFFTNHSLRSTAATRMYTSGLDEQLIAEKTGHRSNSVRSYKRTSDEQQKEISSVIYGHNDKKRKIEMDSSEQPYSSCEKFTEKNNEINVKTKDFSFNLKF